MPVTLTTANHPARKWAKDSVAGADELLNRACPKDSKRSKGTFQSSFSSQTFSESHVSASDHGFVRAVYHAYSSHHHLKLRPEDVWFSILTQLNFFINAHAEELRSFFVSHEGKKDLEVIEVGTIGTVDFGKLALRMTELIQENVVDPELQTWIMPNFSTTTKSDRVVAAILMMGSLQEYFNYSMGLVCGIPTVTLLGERDDWTLLLSKIEKIPEMGEEPAQFANLLRPVLRRFVASFDNPTSPEVIDFWTKCVHETGGSGPYLLSGWVTAFCFWDGDGRSLYKKRTKDSVSLGVFLSDMAGCELDGVFFHRIDTEDVPACSASVPVKVDDNGVVYKTRMVAGVVGIQATSTGSMLDGSKRHSVRRHSVSGDADSETYMSVVHPFNPDPPSEPPGLDTLQPLTGWWMYKTEDPDGD